MDCPGRECTPLGGCWPVPAATHVRRRVPDLTVPGRARRPARPCDRRLGQQTGQHRCAKARNPTPSAAPGKPGWRNKFATIRNDTQHAPTNSKTAARERFGVDCRTAARCSIRSLRVARIRELAQLASSPRPSVLIDQQLTKQPLLSNERTGTRSGSPQGPP